MDGYTIMYPGGSPPSSSSLFRGPTVKSLPSFRFVAQLLKKLLALVTFDLNSAGNRNA